MRHRFLLATTVGLTTLTAGAGIAAAQSDDTTPTTEPATDPSTDVTDPADDGTITTDDAPEPRDRPAGGEGCGDDAGDTETSDTGASTS